MKNLILIITVLLAQLSQAKTHSTPKVEPTIHEMLVEANFHEEYFYYHLTEEVKDGKTVYYIEQYGDSDRSKKGSTKSEITFEQVQFIKAKLDEIKGLKDSPDCEERRITTSFLIDNKTVEHNGCVGGRDTMSVKLHQLSSILMILI